MVALKAVRILRGTAALAAIGLALAHASAKAQVVRQEVHPLASVTLTDTEILKGVREGKPALIAGILQISRFRDERLPAVVILHGSRGIGGETSGSSAAWSPVLNRLGIITFSVDSFTGRDIVSTMEDHSRMGRLGMIVDAYRALALLARHPRVDPNRIALLGAEDGGHAALYAATKRFATAFGAAGAEFAAFMAIYPHCGTLYRDDTLTTGKPIRILHGTGDDYYPIAPCRDYAERARNAGANIQLLEYPGASHGFDLWAYGMPVHCPACATTRKCRMAEGADGVILNTETRLPFTFADACVEKGVWFVYSREHLPKARIDVRTFFKELFGLK